MMVTRNEIYKMNCIALAQYHRKHCDGEHCNISLMFLAEMLTDKGVQLTEEEMKNFI